MLNILNCVNCEPIHYFTTIYPSETSVRFLINLYLDFLSIRCTQDILTLAWRMVSDVKSGYVTLKKSQWCYWNNVPKLKEKQFLRIDPLNSRFLQCTLETFISSSENSRLKLTTFLNCSQCLCMPINLSSYRNPTHGHYSDWFCSIFSVITVLYFERTLMLN
jgi:hypothetical protein